MKKFWIVKKAPVNDLVKGDCNSCYSHDRAVDRARELASRDRSTYVVFEAVDAYGPPLECVRIDITD